MRRLAVLWEFGIIAVETGNGAQGIGEWSGDGEGTGKEAGCAGL